MEFCGNSVDYLMLVCPDYNECLETGDVCNGGKCTNLPGGYRCTCTGGLRPSHDMKQCIGRHEAPLLLMYLKKLSVNKFYFLKT